MSSKKLDQLRQQLSLMNACQAPGISSTLPLLPSASKLPHLLSKHHKQFQDMAPHPIFLRPAELTSGFASSCMPTIICPCSTRSCSHPGQCQAPVQKHDPGLSSISSLTVQLAYMQAADASDRMLLGVPSLFKQSCRTCIQSVSHCSSASA